MTAGSSSTSGWTIAQGAPATALTWGDREAAADLLTEAFFDNPAHVFIYPDAGRRREQLRWLMNVNLGGQLTVGRSFAEVSQSGEIVATAFWHAPGAPKASLLQLARFGFFAMPLRHGWPAFRRMTKTVAELEKRRAACLRGQESWYLNNMVVARAHRGSGVGTRLLRQQLDEVVGPSGFPASLTTQKLENVSFYRRLGFEVKDEAQIGGPGDGFRNWIMVYR